MSALASTPRAGRWLFPVVAFLVFFAHAPFFSLPYFWDELGQFVPAALDLYHDGSLIPHSAVPNAHPPGVMAYLALVWRIFGYSIPATRAAMLLLASLTLLVTFLLASEIFGDWRAALLPVLLLAVDPLFYMQAMLAQLDMPATLFTVLALLLFVKGRHFAAALTCVALVLVKETGALLPLLLALALFFDRPRSKRALYYLAPFAILGAWFLLLWHATHHIFGDPGFTQYNVDYALHPIRACLSFARRLYYLFIADFRWILSLAMLYAWRKTPIYATRNWKIIWSFIAAHIVMVSLLGGAELERYLLPVLPLIYTAAAAALLTLRPVLRNTAVVACTAGLLAGLFVNPPFPFPYENNLAMIDFVDLDRAAAQFLEENYPSQIIYTAWPLTAALRNPAFGYIQQPLQAMETSDLHYSTLLAFDPRSVGVLVLYSRTWEPDWGVLRWQPVQQFLGRFYDYQRQMSAAEVREHFGLTPVRRWSKRGQWIEIYSRGGQPAPPKTVLSIR